MLLDYVYVICERVDGLPSFRHAFIKAYDEEHAYEVGRATVRQPTGEGLNDYVIELLSRSTDDYIDID